jgi:MFS family permease
VPAAQLPGETNAKKAAGPDMETGLTASQAVRTPQFWMLFVTFLLFLSSLGLVMLHLVPYAVDSGMPPVQAAVLITLIGIFGIGGRLSSGILSDRIGIKPVMVFCSILLGLDIAWISFSNTPWSFYVFASVYGLSYSGFVTQMVRITRTTFGGRALGAIFAALMVSDGLGFGLGPWIAGNIFDATGSYHVSYLAAAFGMVLAAALTIIVQPALRPKDKL